ncbi:hypothetical protein BOO69_09645 [Sulfitobacter alexandrii]|uniref:Phage head morphogenesis domain-containing protein n=1 Tax=Sulfitobacter alexandrii TaxID=1917485 RepID=A0A1J0WHK0_9RHOB|nr:phage minor head protein [Sulfitobacter alexandrii]APE43648.1 hypothetical protein BOO69_09645 [Sulfitobacter alexandrii]
MAEIELQPLAPREALEFFRSKGFAPQLQRFDYRDFWREEHARGFVVAKAMRDDVLAEIRSAVDAGLAEGTTLQQFQRDLAPRLRAMGWWGKGIERDPVTGELTEVELGSMRRLKVIFDTNLRTAYAAGQWARLQRTKAFLPYLEYRQVDRETKREEHEPFDGLILPIDHPLWGRIFPPNGWFCACYVRPMNDRMLEREGKRLTTDEEIADLEASPWTNPRTGETGQLLDGLDPSFASNPGQAWLEIDDRHAASALDLPPTHVAADRGYVKELAALRLRDPRNAALVYALDAPPEDPPAGLTRTSADDGQPAPLSEDMRALLDGPGGRNVLIRAEGTSAPFRVDDVTKLLASPALDQVALVYPDGSIFRIGRASEAQADLAARFAYLDRRAQDVAAAWPGRETLSSLELTLVARHALLRALAERGTLSYAAAPSGRIARLLGPAVDLIPLMGGLIDQVI